MNRWGCMPPKQPKPPRTDLEAAANTIDALSEELDRLNTNWRALRKWIGERWAANRALGGRTRLLKAIMNKMDAIEAGGEILPLLEAILAEERARRGFRPENLMPDNPDDPEDPGDQGEDRPW